MTKKEIINIINANKVIKQNCIIIFIYNNKKVSFETF